jgi:hypothetical protein
VGEPLVAGIADDRERSVEHPAFWERGRADPRSAFTDPLLLDEILAVQAAMTGTLETGRAGRDPDTEVGSAASTARGRS